MSHIKKKRLDLALTWVDSRRSNWRPRYKYKPATFDPNWPLMGRTNGTSTLVAQGGPLISPPPSFSSGLARGTYKMNKILIYQCYRWKRETLGGGDITGPPPGTRISICVHISLCITRDPTLLPMGRSPPLRDWSRWSLRSVQIQLEGYMGGGVRDIWRTTWITEMVHLLKCAEGCREMNETSRCPISNS